MDASYAMFAPGYLVSEGYGNRSGTASYRARLHRSPCLWGGIERRHFMGYRQGLDKFLWIVVFLLVLRLCFLRTLLPNDETFRRFLEQKREGRKALRAIGERLLYRRHRALPHRVAPFYWRKAAAHPSEPPASGCPTQWVL